MASKLDAEIDRLFRLPPGDFTAARNALAKEAGKEGAAIKALAKPPTAAWAVNQLYWKRRDEYDALIEAAEEMRRTHKAVIEGRRGDLRGISREHDEAVGTALKSTLELLAEEGLPVTDATRQGVLNTLRALPGEEPPGRLTRALAPGGFEVLAGIRPAARKSAPAKKAQAEPPRQKEKEKAALRDAEQRARRAEFEAARAVREATKAEKRLEEARRAVDRVRTELESAEREAARAEREVAAAIRARETAEQKARDAESALTLFSSKR